MNLTSSLSNSRPVTCLISFISLRASSSLSVEGICFLNEAKSPFVTYDLILEWSKSLLVVTTCNDSYSLALSSEDTTMTSLYLLFNLISSEVRFDSFNGLKFIAPNMSSRKCSLRSIGKLSLSSVT